MTKSLIALAFAAACGLLAFAAPAAAQVTIQGCSNATFSNNVLTCGGGTATPPVCTWPGAAVTSWTTGNTMTLTPNCTNSPTSYAWTVTGTLGGGADCATKASCSDTHPVGYSGAMTYSLVASNSAGPSAALATTVMWADGVGIPTGCTIAPSTQNFGSAGNAAITPLVVSCSGGAPVTTWVWSKTGTCGGTAVSSTATQTDSAPANTGTSQTTCTYKATVSNGAGTVATPPTATVNVAGVSVGLQACSGSGLTGGTNNTLFENPIPWTADSGNNNATSALTHGPMGPGKAYVGVVNVPAGLPLNATNVGTIDVHEYGPAPFSRWVTISKTPCDFQTNVTGNIYAQYSSNNVIRFTIGPNSLGYIPMMPGETWYVNVRPVNPTKLPSLGCGTGYCDFAVSMHAPPGTF
jgi:hypothetical protein